jgi:hypothetical protein
MRRSRLLISLIAAALVACGKGSTEPLSRSDIFEQVWSRFDRYYAFFELGKIDWGALGATYRDSVAQATTDREAARLIGAMIGRLNDYHADLITPFGSFGAPPIPHPHHFSPDVMRTRYFQQPVRSTASSRIQYAPLANNVGYIYIGSFVGEGWGGQIEDALTALGGVTRLVLDIRDNVGGNEDVGLDVARRFYDTERVYRVSRFRNGPNHADFAAPVARSLGPGGSRRFRGPVALITNRWNGSAAEDFTLMMRVLPNVIVVGDTTLGLGSNPRTESIANGWSVRIPQSIQATPDGFVYQWRGLPPGVAVDWDAQQVAAGRDPYVDTALARLASMPTP